MEVLEFANSYKSDYVKATGQKSKCFKSPGNPKSIGQEITELYAHLQKILREQNKDF